MNSRNYRDHKDMPAYIFIIGSAYYSIFIYVYMPIDLRKYPFKMARKHEFRKRISSTFSRINRLQVKKYIQYQLFSKKKKNVH